MNKLAALELWNTYHPSFRKFTVHMDMANCNSKTPKWYDVKGYDIKWLDMKFNDINER